MEISERHEQCAGSIKDERANLSIPIKWPQWLNFSRAIFLKLGVFTQCWSKKTRTVEGHFMAA